MEGKNPYPKVTGVADKNLCLTAWNNQSADMPLREMLQLFLMLVLCIMYALPTSQKDGKPLIIKEQGRMESLALQEPGDDVGRGETDTPETLSKARSLRQNTSPEPPDAHAKWYKALPLHS